RDIAARIGGEEFAVFLESANLQTAADVAERIRAKVQEAVAKDSGLVNRTITVSIGISTGVGGQSVDELMSYADRNLYRAEGLGRSSVLADHSRTRSVP